MSVLEAPEPPPIPQYLREKEKQQRNVWNGTVRIRNIALTPHQSNPMHSHSEYTKVKEPTSAEPEQELREEEEYMQEALDVKKVGYAVNESAALFMMEACDECIECCKRLIVVSRHMPRAIVYHQRSHCMVERGDDKTRKKGADSKDLKHEMCPTCQWVMIKRT